MAQSHENTLTPVQYYILIGITIILFGILLFRIYDLQIRKYSDFSSEAVKNMYRKYNVPAPRGIIYDRYNRPLVYNQSNYDLEVYPFEIRQSEHTWEVLSEILHIPAETLKERMEKNMNGYYRPSKIASSLDFRTVSLIHEYQLELSGVTLTSRPTRQYAQGVQAGHLLGYTAEIDKNSIELLSNQGYRPGDYIGVKGVEKSYEKELKGINGTRYVRINAYGMDFGEDFSKSIPVVPGNDLYLTINKDLQNYVESLADTLPFSVTVLDYTNGEILAMTSQPGFDPAIFSGIVEMDDWLALLNDPCKPLINRTVQGLYPPGSIFKLIAVVAALEDYVISPSKEYHCSGSYRLGRRVYKCWKEAGHGALDLYGAIENSCNVYFYNLIQDVGLERWHRYGRAFRVGTLTGIDIPEEKAGILPDKRYLDEKYGRNGWTVGMLLNMVIGQGDVLVTPIDMARYTCLLASRGKIITPHVGRAIYDKKEEKLRMLSFPEDSVQGVHDRVWDVIHEGMRRVVAGENGTAKVANIPHLEVYGKTGTAQNPHGEAHGWFIGFVKDIQFPYAIVVFVENGKSGSGSAAPMARKIFDYFWKVSAF
ncbi:MAG: penicillin-binding protein 2 [Marinimicrobia bacterium 46_43]|nr:MAG: penicillin-binding protein 2 [Marinimicrobia bacterium 46_43]HBY17648.1 penicillin-binding protein 2 [Candidatus Neomarinimicrobiota bacterium]